MLRNKFFYAPQNIDNIAECIDSIISQAKEDLDARILRIIVFGGAENNTDYISQRSIVSEAIAEGWGDVAPVWSFISQPPFESALAAEVWWCDDSEWTIEDKSIDGCHYISLTKADAKQIMVGGLSALYDASPKKIYDQSKSVCDQIASILAVEDMPIDSIVRQWNYIELITLENEYNQNYQEFNDARSELYSAAKWELGYPAATGIGAISGGLVIDFDAVVGFETKPIDNNLQVAAHEYSEEVLIGDKSKKTTPKFERAKLSNGMLYVSGTAAIRGEESLVGVSAAEQSRITLENIDVLREASKSGSAKSLRVYIKYKEDYEQIREVVEQYAPKDVLYVFADICRDELLVEIESVAYQA